MATTPSAYAVFAGVDWGNTTHALCVLDSDGQLLRARTVAHSGPGLAELVRTLRAAAPDALPDAVCVVVELARGPVVETLRAAGFHVYVCTPKQTDRFRDRFSAARAKDDPLDARILASVGRTDRHLLRRVAADGPDAIYLRELSRVLDALTGDLTRHTNRLRDLLVRVWPGLLGACPAADEPWLWALLALAPTPAQGARVRVGTLEKLLRAHRIRRLTAAQLKAVLAEPAVVVGAGVWEASAAHVGALLPIVRTLAEQKRVVEGQLARRVEAMAAAAADNDDDASDGQAGPGAGRARPSDAAILRSVPGVGVGTVAALLGEHAEAIAARDVGRVRGESGTAPVTQRSGKQVLVRMRRACNGRLRGLLHMTALNAMRVDAASRAYYLRARARGHTAARALRGLADRLLHVAFAMLRNGTLYDPTRWGAHGAPSPSEVPT